ncbi:MAG: pyrroline-5-carboxylate reductase [Eubacterium sp.]|nr:pyrroline-5-carboxylate reductase [Eubacterium sp.]
MFGIIGCGNMGEAILTGILGADIFKPEEVIVSHLEEDALKKIHEKHGVNTTTDNKEVASKADVILISIKPYQFEEVIPQIRDEVGEDKLVISIAAGQTLDSIMDHFGKAIHLVRTMPNTPALVGAGATGMCFSDMVTEEEKGIAISIFESFGIVSVVPEKLIDTVIGVSGSSPAYVFMFIEAMADAAVADGMARVDAYRMAAQAVYGSAKMVLETGKHPGELKDMVCSPAGTTIEAVRVLEEMGFRSAVIEGQMACVQKAKELAGNK